MILDFIHTYVGQAPAGFEYIEYMAAVVIGVYLFASVFGFIRHFIKMFG